MWNIFGQLRPSSSSSSASASSTLSSIAAIFTIIKPILILLFLLIISLSSLTTTTLSLANNVGKYRFYFHCFFQCFFKQYDCIDRWVCERLNSVKQMLIKNCKRKNHHQFFWLIIFDLPHVCYMSIEMSLPQERERERERKKYLLTFKSYVWWWLMIWTAGFIHSFKQKFFNVFFHVRKGKDYQNGVLPVNFLLEKKEKFLMVISL